MDSGTYEFSALKNKYKDFIQPSVEILLDGSKLAEEYVIFDVGVDATIENSSVSAAVFKVQSSKNYLKKPDEFSIMKNFPLMKKIEIKMGYEDKLKSVFTGYIFERVLNIDGGYPPELMVTCFCGKALLRMNTACEAYKEISNLSGLATSILEKYSFSTQIDSSEKLAKKMTVVQQGTTDFSYLCKLAEELGYEFFYHQNKMYFRKPMSVAGNIIKLEADNIFHLELKTSMTDIISKVELYGYNQDSRKAETATADGGLKKIGSGKTGAELIGSLPATYAAYLYMNAKSSKTLANPAKVYLQNKSISLVSLEVTTPGLPEVIPGRFIALEKLGEDVNNTYYIQAVKHTQKEADYKTIIKCVSNTVAK